MIDHNTILAVLKQLDPETKRLPPGMLAFAQAMWSLGRDAGLEEAAQKVEASWKAGYRGEVNTGFASLVRSLKKSK